MALAGMVLLIRRIMRKQQSRVEAELRAAQEGMGQSNMGQGNMGRQKSDQGVQLELDPATGVYRPRQ